MVPVLFARRDSIYKIMADCDVWDIDRDARNYHGSAAIVAHPPCRAWGRLRQFANPRPDEKQLALWIGSAKRLIELSGVWSPAWRADVQFREAGGFITDRNWSQAAKEQAA